MQDLNRIAIVDITEDNIEALSYNDVFTKRKRERIKESKPKFYITMEMHRP